MRKIERSAGNAPGWTRRPRSPAGAGGSRYSADSVNASVLYVASDTPEAVAAISLSRIARNARPTRRPRDDPRRREQHERDRPRQVVDPVVERQRPVGHVHRVEDRAGQVLRLEEAETARAAGRRVELRSRSGSRRRCRTSRARGTLSRRAGTRTARRRRRRRTRRSGSCTGPSCRRRPAASPAATALRLEPGRPSRSSAVV